MRKVISKMINDTRGMEVVGIARNGAEGVLLAQELKPDVITMDIEMPELDGLGALRQIRVKCRSFNPAVLMCSSLTTQGSAEAFKALRLGASDIIAKDPATVGKQDAGFKTELISKIRAIAGDRPHTRTGTNEPTKPGSGRTRIAMVPTHPTVESAGPPKDIDLAHVSAVVIGSSTGGPPVLEDILGAMPAGLRVPIIVAQHMPALFTKTLTERLDRQGGCSAHLITDRTNISEPAIYVAEGGRHLHITPESGGSARGQMREEPAEAPYRPSVDVLFETASRVYGSRLLAIQLTGMGEDGARGAAAIRKAGGRVITQDAESCVVYGMPRAVVESGNSDASMTPAQIGGLLAQLCAAPSVQSDPAREARRTA